MKLPVYFEAFGSIGITVSFVGKDTKTGEVSTRTMLLAECPEIMRNIVNRNADHFKTKNSGYELKGSKYVLSNPIGV